MMFHDQERQAVLACRSVSKTYGSQAVVSDVTLEVAPGEVVGLLGANGAGKTTLMRMACGLVRPTSGSVRVLGEHPPYSPAVARQVGAALDTPAFYRWMTGPTQLRSLLHSSGLPDRGQVSPRSGASAWRARPASASAPTRRGCASASPWPPP